ncbi:MAG: Ferredoxin-2 (modular protein) [Promethearchaeota archaeon]|jgi:ferredoxin-like protein FixX|nr:MAG: Ferredoxin-2 (modular protein) [Candidatus Lokiarchaeota archaeon]
MEKKYKEFPGVHWVPAPEDFISIEKDLCNGCAACLKVCLANCFELKNGKAKIKSLEKCMECSSCWYICPTEAINFTYPAGGTGFKTNFG